MNAAKTNPSDTPFDVAVIGGGPTGQAMAKLAGDLGLKTALVAPEPQGEDPRTTALLMASVRMLVASGMWEALSPQAAPLVDMRIVDGTERLIRAPETLFKSSELGLEAFGYNIRNTALNAAFARAAAADPHLEIVKQAASSVSVEADAATIGLADGSSLRARLAIGADGRRSVVREAAGISVREWRYEQVALVCNFRHSEPHFDTSTEIHTPSGPFTMVPLGHRVSSLVWVVTPKEAERLMALSRDDLAAEIEARGYSILGKVEPEAEPRSFPLSGMVARSVAGPRTALVGEAAHVFPPIGAQGLNLGLRDVAMLAELLARRSGDPGARELLAEYERARRPDIMARTAAVDLLNRSLLTDFLGVQGLRGIGMYVAGRIAPLRKLLMREGVAPHIGLPRLMRGLPLRPGAARPVEIATG